MNGFSTKYHQISIGLILALMILVCYWPVIGYDFIALDDNLYIVENPHIQKGITPKGVVWAMTTRYTTNWHPLTWLSYMADYDISGLNPVAYHISNLILHLLNTFLLFILLQRITGEIWKGAMVAALFAVHPLNIESVVWIAERKNLLSTLLGILTILAYVRYVEKPGWFRYGPVLILFVLSLTAKPMLVTMPFILLLLDYWPLQRFSSLGRSGTGQNRRWRLLNRLLIEKAPLILISLVSAFVTFQAAREGGAVKALSVFPLSGRIENACISYGMYLVKTVWPVDLAIFYPYPVDRPFWHLLLAVLSFATVTGFILARGRTYRYLITGWFWYGITLLPVIGIVQVGFQSMANRYAYVSLIGIFVIIVWGVPDLLKGFSARRYMPVAAVTLLATLAFCTKSELPNWRNSEAAFQRALNVTRDNHIAEMGMGNVWLGRGDLRKARSHYLESLRIKPDYPEAHNNLALILMREGRADEAAVQYREALKDNPDYAEAYNNLGVIYAGQGKQREAEINFRRALELKPDYVGAQGNLAKLLLSQGRFEAAVEHFRRILEIEPENIQNQSDLADALKKLPASRNGHSENR
jgi:protein O-mannosyl-transferase